MVNVLHFSDIHIPDKRRDLWYGVDPFKKQDALALGVYKGKEW